MRCHYLVLLVAAILFASVNAAVEMTDSKLITGDQIDIPAKRALRTSTNVEEERGIADWLGKAAPKLLLTDDQLEHLALQRKPTGEVFNLLKLDDGLKGFLTNPNLMAFRNYLIKTDIKYPGEVLLATMINKYGDEAVAKYLYEAKQVAQTKETAQHLQAAQFVRWFEEGKTGNQVFNLLRLKHNTYGIDPFHNAWWDYVVAYARLASKPKKPLPVEVF